MSGLLEEGAEKAETMYQESTRKLKFKKTTKIIGLPVEDTNGESLGEIEDIVLNFEDNTIKYAIISFGGFLGFGEKLFAIPWEVLDFKDAELTFVLNVDKENLEDAPSFHQDKCPVMTMDWADELHQYYGLKNSLRKPKNPKHTDKNMKKEMKHDMRL